MGFFGKVFKFEKAENHDEFVSSLDFPSEVVGFFMNFTPQKKFEKTGDTYVLTVNTPRGHRQVPFTSGVEFEDTVRDLPVINKLTVDGNTVTHVIKFDNGVSITSIKEFTGNKLIEKLTNSKWNGVATIYYSA